MPNENRLQAVAEEAQDLIDGLTVTVNEAQQLVDAIRHAEEEDALKSAVEELAEVVRDAVRDHLVSVAGGPDEAPPDTGQGQDDGDPPPPGEESP